MENTGSWVRMTGDYKSAASVLFPPPLSAVPLQVGCLVAQSLPKVTKNDLSFGPHTLDRARCVPLSVLSVHQASTLTVEPHSQAQIPIWNPQQLNDMK